MDQIRPMNGPINLYSLEGFFLLFCVFLLQWGWWREKVQKMVQNERKCKKISLVMTSQEKSNSHHVWYTGLNSTSLLEFSDFWKNFDFTMYYRHKKVKHVLQTDIFNDIFSDIYPTEHPITMIFHTQKDIQVVSKTF